MKVKPYKSSSQKQTSSAETMDPASAALLQSLQASRKRKHKSALKDEKFIEEDTFPATSDEESDNEDSYQNQVKRAFSKQHPLTLKERIQKSVEAKLESKEKAEMVDQLREQANKEWKESVRFLVGLKTSASLAVPSHLRDKVAAPLKLNKMNEEKKALDMLSAFENQVRNLQESISTSQGADAATPAEEEPSPVTRDTIYCLRVYSVECEDICIPFLCHKLSKGVSRLSQLPLYLLYTRVLLEILQRHQKRTIFLPELAFALEEVGRVLMTDCEQFSSSTSDDLRLCPDELSSAAVSPWKSMFQWLHQLKVLLDLYQSTETHEASSANDSKDPLDRLLSSPQAKSQCEVLAVYCGRGVSKYLQKVYDWISANSDTPRLVLELARQVHPRVLRVGQSGEMTGDQAPTLLTLRPKIQLLPLYDPLLEFPKEDEKKRASRAKREKRAHLKQMKRKARVQAKSYQEDALHKRQERERKTKKLIGQLKAQEWREGKGETKKATKKKDFHAKKGKGGKRK